MASYYNEIAPKAAAWLRELIKDGQIAEGDVDERSIADVRPGDLRGYVQCHFFAGIGGWSYALRLAGWPDDRPVWTDSCPCQPFSSAGAQVGGDDPRHLWPAWFRLIRECRPAVIFGEQVEAAIAHGWLDLVCDDLEREGYAVGAVGLPACSVGAFHIRSRLWFVADRQGGGQRIDRRASGHAGHVDERGAAGDVADADGRYAVDGAVQRGGQYGLRSEDRCPDGRTGDAERPQDDVADVDGERRQRERLHAPIWQPQPAVPKVAGTSEVGELGNGERARLEGLGWDGDDRHEPGRIGAHADRPASATGGVGFWSDVEWLPCRDGKARPTQPGLQPLAWGTRPRGTTARLRQCHRPASRRGSDPRLHGDRVRRAGKIDANQREIVRALEKRGCAVQSLASLGGGVPDLLVARDGRLFLLEVKTASGRLTPAQVAFHARFPVAIVRTVEAAIQAVAGGPARE